jgi:hypothetical protein
MSWQLVVPLLFTYLECDFVSQDGGVSMSDIGEGSSVDEHRGALDGLHLRANNLFLRNFVSFHLVNGRNLLLHTNIADTYKQIDILRVQFTVKLK